MADRYGFQYTKTLNPGSWILPGVVTIGTGVNGQLPTGPLPLWMAGCAATGVPANPSGLFTGIFDVQLTDSWVGLQSVSAFLQAVPTGSIGVSGGDFAGGITNNNKLIVQVIASDVVISKHVVLQITDSTTGLGIYPAAGQKLFLSLVVSNNGSI